MASFSNIYSFVAVCCCLVVSLVASAPIAQTNCSSLDPAGDIKRVIVITQDHTVSINAYTTIAHFNILVLFL